MEVTLLDRFSRNKDLIPQEKLRSLTVIGAGGIGSAVSIQTAIMGWKEVDFWDDDKIEIHNLSTTTYPMDSLGQYKADIAVSMQGLFGSANQQVEATPMIARIDDRIEPRLIKPNVIICTDNMQSRLDTYQLWKSKEDRNAFIDVRMGALSINVATVTRKNDEYLAKDWYADEDVEDEPCTMKHTIFTAQYAASLGMKQLFLVLKKMPFYAYITRNLATELTEVQHERLILKP